jgi:DNA modification methylase
MNKDIDYKKDLAEKLEELKKIEGFPIGSDEDILALSQPPYYTACPNPYINDFIKEYGKPYNEDTDDYHREPFVGDVSEGKTDPIYMAHTYHTKVPYKAILPFIEHYTNEGDTILDAFAGSGMTGVAAKTLKRNCILSDLSPVASLMENAIVSNINSFDYQKEFVRLISEVQNDYKWLFETIHNKTQIGIINYIVWSEVLSCPFCANEYVFWDEAFSENELTLKSKYVCPNCNALISKSDSNKVIENSYDEFLKREIQTHKYAPVQINYKYGKGSFFKKPDIKDYEKIETINNLKITDWVPLYQYMFKEGNWGDMWRSGVHFGVTHSHHFFTKTSLIFFARMIRLAFNSKFKTEMLFTITSFLTKTGSKLHNIGFKNGKINLAGAQPNSLYIPSIYAERNLFSLALVKQKSISKAFESVSYNKSTKVFSQTCSATNLNIHSNSVDYIFTDPPFGDNLMYSEMNFIWESWLKVFTNNGQEAIINKSQNKDINEYSQLMLASFREYYRVLKPKRWITVVFHNSKSSVWNVLQNTLSKAGFIISQVSILDKKQGTKNQMIAAGAVEKDLVISAFKPTKQFERKLIKTNGADFENDFIYEFLNNQPVKPLIERTEKMLYSKLIAFYIQRGYEVRLDAKTFYSLLKSNFIESDGFWFNLNQIEQFEEFKKRMKLDSIDEIRTGLINLFISDEKSSIIWLFNFLDNPKTLSDIHSAYTQLANFQDDDVPELKEILEQNFIVEDGKYRRPQSDIEHNAINEKRQKNLKREFETLLVQAQTQNGKIKQVRKEALVYGFELCYKEKRFADILSIANKLDKSILENSGELNDFIEAAEIMIEGIS